MAFFRFAFVLLLTSAAALVGVSFSQTSQTTLPTDPGMCVEAAGSFTRSSNSSVGPNPNKLGR